MKLDNEGYLLDPADWSDEVAEALARAEHIVLTEEHWAVLRFMRQYYEEHAIPADARFAIRCLAEQRGHGTGARKRLFELFPYGYVKQACRIAGMRRPRIWSTG
jgi:TusE/DsrC/DsvC family sulfur relay protein